jgi:hypothetical protein
MEAAPSFTKRPRSKSRLTVNAPLSESPNWHDRHRAAREWGVLAADPFYVVTRFSEKAADLAACLQQCFQVGDDEVKKWRIAIQRDSSSLFPKTGLFVRETTIGHLIDESGEDQRPRLLLLLSRGKEASSPGWGGGSANLQRKVYPCKPIGIRDSSQISGRHGIPMTMCFTPRADRAQRQQSTQPTPSRIDARLRSNTKGFSNRRATLSDRAAAAHPSGLAGFFRSEIKA